MSESATRKAASPPKVAALLLAGGSGNRMQGHVEDKALLPLGGTWFAFADGDDTGGSPTTTATTPPTSTTTVPLAVTEPTTTIAQQAVTTSTTSTSIPTTSTSTTTTTTTTTTPTPTTATTTTTPTTTTTTTTTTAPQVIVPPTPAPPAPPTPAPPTPPPPTPAPRPGQLVLSASSIDLGATATPSQLRLANTGDLPLNWTITGNANPFLWSSTSGALAAGATVDVPVGIDRAALAEGDVVRNFTVTSSAAGTAPLTLRAAVEHPPVVQFVTAPTSLMCPGPSGSPVLVSVSDESSISGVQLIWTGPGPTGSASMMQIGSSWESLLGPDPVNGTWTWEARATDARGNVGSISAPFIVSGC